MNQSQSRSFHLHVDATCISESFYSILKNEFRFLDSEFSGHPEGYRHFEPNRHLTLKFTNGNEFRKTCNELEHVVSSYPDFIGYFEGEYVREERFILDAEYHELPVPFKINRRRLNGSVFEQFRESELHLTLDKDRSNPQLIQSLLDAGLYGAYLPKKEYVALVLTIQGFREDIGGLIDCLWEYIANSGGTVRCKLKEEFATWYKLYGIEPTNLPEIIDRIEYFR